MARTFSERSLNNLRGVHPDLIRVCQVALHISPVDFVIIDGLRTKEEQAVLLAEGASRTMNSRHLHGLAVDLMAIDPKTDKGSWDTALYLKLGPAVKRAAEIEKVPVEWGGDWKKFRDYVHFQLPHSHYRDKLRFEAEDPEKVKPLRWKPGKEISPALNERLVWESEMEAALSELQALWARKPKD